MIKLCPRCAPYARAATEDHPHGYEETCLGGWGRCDHCKTLHTIRGPNQPYEGQHTSLAFFKADLEELAAMRIPIARVG